MSLCLECGLCCDGTFFGATAVGHDAEAVLERASVVLVHDPRTVRIQQPCAAHVDGCCSIYDERPATCRAFECALLADVREGRVTPDDARAVVVQANALRDTARGLLEGVIAPPDLSALTAAVAVLGVVPVPSRPLQSIPALMALARDRLDDTPAEGVSDEILTDLRRAIAAGEELFVCAAAHFGVIESIDS